MATNANIAISNFQAINLGNGKSVALSWSVTNLALIKFFIVEYWNRDDQKWVAYDGFHGCLSSKNNDNDPNPPQKVTFDVPYTNCNVAFRVKTIDNDGVESDWSNSSTEISSMQITSGTIGGIDVSDEGLSIPSSGGDSATPAFKIDANGRMEVKELYVNGEGVITADSHGGLTQEIGSHFKIGQTLEVFGWALVHGNFVTQGSCLWGVNSYRTDRENLTDFSFNFGASNKASGFYIANNPSHGPDSGTNHEALASGYPGTYWHVINCRHLDPDPNSVYQMQFAGDFFDSNNLFYRAMNNNSSTPWNRVWHSGQGYIDVTTINKLTTINCHPGNKTANYDVKLEAVAHASSTTDGSGTLNLYATAFATPNGAKIYNAVYNDYAEFFLKEDELEPGDVVMKNQYGNGYIKACGAYNSLVVGVVSDEWGYCIGGNKEDVEERYSSIGLAGRVKVKVYGPVKEGDLLVASVIPGVAKAARKYIPGTVVGKALEHHDGFEINRIEMLILNM